IRLKANSITLDGTVGLNGIQLANNLSSDGDSIYLTNTFGLISGVYGDPSSLVNNGLIIDKQIKLVGWQGDSIQNPGGVSAKTGGRTQDGTDESILDFANATGAGPTVTAPPVLGVVIKNSNVTIDGVDVRLNSTQGSGIRIDSSVARSNINIVNNFVHGGAAARINGSAIENNGGAQLLTNVTIKDNSISNASVAGIHIDNAIGV